MKIKNRYTKKQMQFKNRYTKKQMQFKNRYTKKQMQIKLYKSIFNDYSSDNLHKIIKKICINFNSQRCQKIFRDLIINIFYTLYWKVNKLNRNIVYNFSKKIKNYKINKFILPINLNNDLNNIEIFLYLFQDHTYGHFKYANLAWLTYSLIHNI